jgi:outer membrane protein assembly factor BamB
MRTYPTLRRWLSAGVTLAVLMGVVAFAALSNRTVQKDDPPKVDKNYPWPLFGGTLNRNLVNLVDKNIPIDFSVVKGKEKFVKWKQALGSKSYAGPVIAEGRVFIGTNNERPRDPAIKGDKGIIMCFDEATGDFKWQKVYDKLSSGIVSDWPKEGICSTPVIEAGKMYYVSNRSWVVCADVEKGKIIWKLDMIKDLGVFPHNLSTCSPLIVGDRIFVCTSNGVDQGHINIPAPKAPSFIAVDKVKGKVLWQNNDPSKNLLKLPTGADKDKKEGFIKKLVDSGQLLMHGQWANPCYTEVDGVAQVIFPGGDGWLRAFDPMTGKVIWKFDCNPKDAKYVLGSKGTRNDFVNTPVVADNRLYIGVGQDPEHLDGVGHFWCVDLTRATALAKKSKEGDVDVSPRDKAFDPKDPANKDSALGWHYGGEGKKADRPKGADFIFGRTLSTACVHNGLVYIAELAGYLHCLDAKTGKRQWYERIGDEKFGITIWSSPYYCDGKVFQGADDDHLYVFRAGKEKEQLARINVRGKVRATPVVANGVLYVMTENMLYAIKK